MSILNFLVGRFRVQVRANLLLLWGSWQTLGAPHTLPSQPWCRMATWIDPLVMSISETNPLVSSTICNDAFQIRKGWSESFFVQIWECHVYTICESCLNVPKFPPDLIAATQICTTFDHAQTMQRYAKKAPNLLNTWHKWVTDPEDLQYP